MIFKEQYITDLLDEAVTVSSAAIDVILNKAERFEGLTHQETAALLMTSNPQHISRMYAIAEKIKQHIYGERIVVFAPLYVSDYCINGCSYCGFRHNNIVPRRKLTQAEVETEVKILEKMGHKRIALEAGEDPENCPLDYILECIDTIYRKSDIRRVNVNIAALSTEDFKQLKDAQIGTYILFQETYHRSSYEKVHISGPKADFDYHLTAFDRAMEAKIDDVGAGVLFGLYDYKFEVLALMLHNEYLEKQFGVGFHTVSVPRLRSIDSTAESNKTESDASVSDEDFLKLVAIIRMAVPFTGMIVSTRESPEIRRKLIQTGISQMSAGSSTVVGGYSALTEKEDSVNNETTKQFSLADHRKPSEIYYWLMEEKILPSFCTACYRSGRSGDRFMSLAKSGEIKNVCLPNGLLTLMEYSLDFGDERFKYLAEKLIDEKLSQMNNTAQIEQKLKQLKNGERDLFV